MNENEPTPDDFLSHLLSGGSPALVHAVQAIHAASKQVMDLAKAGKLDTAKGQLALLRELSERLGSACDVMEKDLYGFFEQPPDYEGEEDLEYRILTGLSQLPDAPEPKKFTGKVDKDDTSM